MSTMHFCRTWYANGAVHKLPGVEWGLEITVGCQQASISLSSRAATPSCGPSKTGHCRSCDTSAPSARWRSQRASAQSSSSASSRRPLRTCWRSGDGVFTAAGDSAALRNGVCKGRTRWGGREACANVGACVQRPPAAGAVGRGPGPYTCAKQSHVHCVQGKSGRSALHVAAVRRRRPPPPHLRVHTVWQQVELILEG